MIVHQLMVPHNGRVDVGLSRSLRASLLFAASSSLPSPSLHPSGVALASTVAYCVVVNADTYKRVEGVSQANGAQRLARPAAAMVLTDH